MATQDYRADAHACRAKYMLNILQNAAKNAIPIHLGNIVRGNNYQLTPTHFEFIIWITGSLRLPRRLLLYYFRLFSSYTLRNQKKLT